MRVEGQKGREEQGGGGGREAGVRIQGSGGRRSLERDAEMLAELVRRHGAYRLVVIDPISAYLEGADLNRDGDVRSVLSRLADLAEGSGRRCFW